MRFKHELRHQEIARVTIGAGLRIYLTAAKRSSGIAPERDVARIMHPMSKFGGR